MILTEELLKEIKNGEVFRVVTTKYQTVHSPFFAELTFVCKKGGIKDWAIYAGPVSWGIERIKNMGDKVSGKEMIKSICPCDESAFELYRY